LNPEVKPGTLSEPISDNTVSTKGGYWLIQVSDKENNRKLEEGDRNSLMTKAFNDWVSSLWVDASGNVDDSYLTSDKKIWAAEQAAKG
jgi:hypothetical protein